MISARYASQNYDLGLVVIPALSSLTHEHAQAIEDAVQAHAPGWEVDRLDEQNGYLANGCRSVLVSIKDDIDAQPSYLISGMVHRVELSEVRGDTLRELGPFDTLEQAIDALLVSLKSLSRR